VSLRTESLYKGAVERVVLDRPKANILDTQMVRAIAEHVQGLAARDRLKLIVFEGQGRHFSFGASVPEHMPDQVGVMLPMFHRLFRQLEDLGVPSVALVRGQCLGGAAELAIATGRLFCTPTSHIGFPEIKLGVFPPVAAAILHWRVGGNRASELVLTGRSVGAEEALSIGLADEIAVDLEPAWRAWFETHLADRSAASARFAWRASRRHLATSLRADLDALERLYLDELMRHPDPIEGLAAFTEKRQPQWST
jgi:cyclohexa-1,5-dienecarbonyl-CoA hydratase